uniref:Uncharacterized protein n=1 Tax=Arundo donax TaxID=35708 RepID=A0A0A9GVJ6_ARUDO
MVVPSRRSEPLADVSVGGGDTPVHVDEEPDGMVREVGGEDLARAGDGNPVHSAGSTWTNADAGGDDAREGAASRNAASTRMVPPATTSPARGGCSGSRRWQRRRRGRRGAARVQRADEGGVDPAQQEERWLGAGGRRVGGWQGLRFSTLG